MLDRSWTFFWKKKTLTVVAFRQHEQQSVAFLLKVNILTAPLLRFPRCYLMPSCCRYFKIPSLTPSLIQNTTTTSTAKSLMKLFPESRLWVHLEKRCKLRRRNNSWNNILTCEENYFRQTGDVSLLIFFPPLITDLWRHYFDLFNFLITQK